MKLLKVLTIVLLSLFLSFSVSFSQENSTVDSGAVNLQQESDSINIPASEIENVVSQEKTETNTVIPDSNIKKKKPADEGKAANRKKEIKKTPEKKITAVSVEVTEEQTIPVKMDGDLLPITEGNFKYKRIPDIKLTDIKPAESDSSAQVAEVPVPGRNTSSGFLGLSKTASDVIVKGGVLLLILLIFILYKSRMSGPVKKSSKKRNVLNSYRK